MFFYQTIRLKLYGGIIVEKSGLCPLGMWALGTQTQDSHKQ